MPLCVLCSVLPVSISCRPVPGLPPAKSEALCRVLQMGDSEVTLAPAKSSRHVACAM